MANGTRKRKPVQAGVEAIFTHESDWRGKISASFGVFGAVAGSALWIWLITQESSSLSLVSVSMLLVITGVGLCMYSLAIRRTRQETDRLRSALYELEVLPEPKTVLSDQSAETPNGDYRNGNGTTRRGSKILGVVITETVVLILFYGGLVHEYVSNVNMQQWIQSNIWPASFILNYNAFFLVIGGLLGTTIFQVLGKKTS